MTELNVIVIGGYIYKGVSDFNYKNKNGVGIYFPLVVNMGKTTGFINVMIFERDKSLQELARTYIIPENKGKRIIITGSLLLGREDSSGIMVAARDISFTDYLMSAEKAAKEKANHIDFSSD